jgi:drug/metabolite transporter (DMT)-like permease
LSAGLGGVGDRKSGLVLAIVSLAFVLLWSTGHIATKLGDPYIEPFKFLAIRFSLSTIVLVPIVLVIGGRWPRSITAARHIAIAGLLIHAGYLGGVFVAIDLGLSAGALAVITGLQPLLTGIVAASAFGESVTRRQWSGLVLGLGGVALVVSEKAVFEGTPRLAFVAAFLCLISITCGAIYQKRFCPDENIPAMTAIQLCLSAVICAAVSLTIETGAVDWTGELIIAIGWQVIFLSAVATTLLYWLLRQGETTRMTGLFYLMAPTTALMGWFMFGETFGPLGAAGLLVAVAGFWLVFRRRAV